MRPIIEKLGTIACDVVEANSIVWKGEVWRCEWMRKGNPRNALKVDYFHFVNRRTRQTSLAFAHGFRFGCAYAEGDRVYVTGTRDNVLHLWESGDLVTWEERNVLKPTHYELHNTSLCKADSRYVLMFEIGGPPEECGVRFTARFAISSDLREWEVTPPQCNYAKDRYTAPHCLRWLDGWFYDFYLEELPGWNFEQRVVRSQDLIHWQQSPYAVLQVSADDKVIADPTLTAQELGRIEAAKNCNNSDIDFCEFQGKLIMNYSWGDQVGTEFLAEALYDGTQEQFLRSWFPQP